MTHVARTVDIIHATRFAKIRTICWPHCPIIKSSSIGMKKFIKSLRICYCFNTLFHYVFGWKRQKWHAVHSSGQHLSNDYSINSNTLITLQRHNNVAFCKRELRVKAKYYFLQENSCIELLIYKFLSILSFSSTIYHPPKRGFNAMWHIPPP